MLERVCWRKRARASLPVQVRKLLRASARCKLLCASCSAQVLCESCSVNVVCATMLRKLLCASAPRLHCERSTQVALHKLLCASCSRKYSLRVAPGQIFKWSSVFVCTRTAPIPQKVARAPPQVAQPPPSYCKSTSARTARW